MNTMEKYTGLEIAVIGLAGRFPQADTIAQYWDNLRNGKNCIETFSDEEVLREGEAQDLLKNPMYVKAGAYLQNKKYFDAAFFNYRPAEAAVMDPQMRVFHECCWEALEDSGYSSQDFGEKIGLFAAGTPNVNWQLYAAFTNKGMVDDFTASHLRDISFLSSRISYQLNLKGPSVFLQTACSSSLVAIHEACNSLLLGECSIALSGGVTIRNYSRRGYLYKKGMIHSRDGKCRPFDAEASGTVSGEGAGVVALKRLKDAMADGDHVYAVIKGTAVNNDGSRKVGYTAPSVEGQAEVIRKALKMARVAPETVAFMEAHGTATELGDPIEIEALKEAFGLRGAAGKTCAIGSVKSNVGHLDSAAGVAGFIKAVLAIYHKELPASLHFNRPNEKMDFSDGPFYVNTKLQPLKAQAAPLRAGVSSFGIGGTNAHMVLEEFPAPTRSAASAPGRYLVVLSGKTEESLENNASLLRDHLLKNEHINLADAAYTLQTGRHRFKYRSAFTCATREEAIHKLASKQGVKQKAGYPHEGMQNIIFVFPGQGSQYAGMCRTLYEHHTFFRTTIDECLSIAKRFSDDDFYAVLFPAGTGENKSPVNNTRYAQPLLFMIEYALASLLMKWGIRPHFMIGHSIGEFVAACVSKVMSLEDALRLVIRRGQLMSGVDEGSMLGVKITTQALAPFLERYPEIDVAAINSDSQLVVSGNHENIAEIENALAGSGYVTKRLHTSHAFHSRMMDGILKQFEKEASSIAMHKPEIPYISNITGRPVTGEELSTPSYWPQHLRSTVQFARGVETLLAKGDSLIIECGPGRALCNFISESRHYNDRTPLINMVRQAAQKADDHEYAIEKLGELWLNGVPVLWNSYYEGETVRKVSLPTYAFQRTVFTTDVDAEKLIMGDIAKNASSLNPRDGLPMVHCHTWQRTLPLSYPHGGAENILMFSGEQGLSEALVSALAGLGHRVIDIRMGASFRKLSENIFEADLLDPDDFRALTEALRERAFVIHSVIYGVALKERSGPVTYDEIDGELADGYLGLCQAARLLDALNKGQKISVLVLDNFLAGIIDQEDVNPLKSTIHGAARVIPLEFMHIRCKVVDIPYPFADISQQDKYLHKIIAELFHITDEPFISYRFGDRWLPAYHNLSEDPAMTSHVGIQAGEMYMITGGLGGIGLTLAEDLVYNHNANVMLLHRSFFPATEAWNDWLMQNGREDAISKKILKILDMKKAGAAVELYQVDVSVEDAVRALVAHISGRGLHVHGLIWAAGEVDYGGIILNRSRETFIKYLSSKVHGLLLFERYFDFSRLRFVALFSSIGNLLYQAKFGQASYNAANEFLQNYSLYAGKKYNIHAFTINWSDWLDVGITVNTFKRKAQTDDVAWINSQIHGGIAPAEGVAAFHQALRTNAPVYTVYKGNLTEAIAGHRRQYRENMTLLPDSSRTAPVAAETEVGAFTPEDHLLQIFIDFFGNRNITADDDFFELGGDSLKAMTLVARINQKLGVEMSITDLYKHATVRELADKAQGRSAGAKSGDIPRAPVREDYVLSSAQRRLYVIQMLYPDSIIYNETQLFWVKGNLDKKRVEDTFRKLIRRHESLRTGFAMKNGEPRQFVRSDFEFEIQYFDYKDDALENILSSFIRPFDLQRPPLYRVGIVEKTPRENLIMIDLHHIVADGISQRVMIRDFMSLYNGEVLPDVSIQYKDFAEWQQSEAQQENLVKNRMFWLDHFSELPEVLQLPADLPRPEVKTYEGDSIEFKIDARLSKRLKDIAAAENTSTFMVILALYNVLLAKLGNQEDIVVGIPVAGRQHAAVENTVGMFVNTLPLRNAVSGALTFRQFLNKLTSRTLQCFDHQQYQFESLIDDLQISREVNRNPLFDVMFSYKNMEEPQFTLAELSLEPYNNALILSRFDLTLWGIETEDHLSFSFQYSTELFLNATIRKFIGYFQEVISAVVADVDTKLADIEIVKGRERHELVKTLNDTAEFYPKDETIVSLFEKQVSRTPHLVAIRYGDETLSYTALDHEASEIARHLQTAYGVGPGDLVGIMMQREKLLLPVIFGILKSGAAYVPIDPHYPEERVHDILDDAQLKVLVTRREFTTGAKVHDTPLFHLEDSLPVYDTEPGKAFVSEAKSGDAAYVIYTSGSTGKPKGVVIEHHSVVNRIAWMQKKYPITTEDVLLQKTPVVFDVSVWELFWWSFTGASLYLLKPGEEKEPLEITKAIRDHRVTTIHFVPSMLGYFLTHVSETVMQESLKSLRQVFTSGEALKTEHVNLFGETIYKHAQARLINLYGPTEATVDVSYFECTFEKPCTVVPIGKPIDNTQLYILDRYGKLLPYGVAGELCIGGVGVGRGYLNNPQLTDEKFASDPFSGAGKIYRTGDLARLMPDGNIEYLQRMDHQVKIRGQRIELGDIESQLAKHPAIKESVVVLKEKQAEKHLVAYYVSETETDYTAIRAFLAERLPDYMVPSFGVRLERMPLNRNGKLDRRSLPDPEIRKGGDHVAPSGELAERLAAIWAEILGVDKDIISVNKSFFELGGQSLKAVTLISRIEKVFNVKIPLMTFFMKPTIRDLERNILITGLSKKQRNTLSKVTV